MDYHHLPRRMASWTFFVIIRNRWWHVGKSHRRNKLNKPNMIEAIIRKIPEVFTPVIDENSLSVL